MASLDSDSDSDIQQKIEDYIVSSIDHLNSLQEKIKKNAFSEDQLSKAYDICRNCFNSLDAFLQNQPDTNKKQRKSSTHKARKSDSQKKQSFKDDENAVLKSGSSDSDKSDHDQNNKRSIPLKKQSSTPKDKKKSPRGVKKNKYLDSQDLFLQENDK